MNKLLILTLLLVIICTSCKKDKEEKSDKLLLTISSAEWYTKNSTFDSITFCNIYVKVKGNSNARMLSYLTFGDGVLSCGEIKCDINSHFDQELLIFWFPIHDTIRSNFYTIITAYSSRNKPPISFCDAVGSGDTLSSKIISPILTCSRKSKEL